VIKGVKLVSIPVLDLDRALAFYTGQLGFQVRVDEPDGHGQRWIELAIPGADTHLVLSTHESPAHRPGRLLNATLWTEDVTATCLALQAKGVEITQRPSRQSWGECARFRDSEGNEVPLASR